MKQKWKVAYYISSFGEIPVRDFLDSLQKQTKAKIFRILLTIEEYGLHAIIPYVKKLSGTPLWEIRIIGKENIRILYIIELKNQVLLLHAFNKKKQKTPRKEIKIALDRLKKHKLYS